MISSFLSRNCSLVGRHSLFYSQKAMQSSLGTLQEKASGRLQGKKAIVTASTDGIGFAIAQRLVLEGANVLVSSRKQKNVDSAVGLIENEAKKVVGSGKVSGTVCHVANSQDRSALIEKAQSEFGGLDILVSNAAVSPTFGPLVETPEKIWDKIFEINVKSAFLLVQEAAPKLAVSGNSSIVFISSIAGFQPFRFIGAYSISKTALLGLTKALASELGDDGIRVNSVCPGIVKTKLSQAIWESEQINDLLVQQTAAKRIAQPDEISGIVSFLCSDDASYITGENILVSSGMPARL